MDKKGFLLFEVMISILIITTALLFIVRSYSVSKNSIQRSTVALETSLLLEEKMWEFEEKGEIEECSKTGDFRGKEGYSWRLNARHLENSDLNLIDLEVFHKKDPVNTKYSIRTYLRNKEE